MRLSTGRIKLNTAMKTLGQRWEQTKEAWDDSVSRDFEENHVEPLAEQVAATLRGIDRLGEVIEKVYHELQS